MMWQMHICLRNSLESSSHCSPSMSQVIFLRLLLYQNNINIDWHSHVLAIRLFQDECLSSTTRSPISVKFYTSTKSSITLSTGKVRWTNHNSNSTEPRLVIIHWSSDRTTFDEYLLTLLHCALSNSSSSSSSTTCLFFPNRNSSSVHPHSANALS
mmetsp:Transcript_40248/g.72502  ORF Transcript_40248/g.72502 Transcript_40248/m.72502 type:complete len:155 (+) Transcript_40248:95-559(+)